LPRRARETHIPRWRKAMADDRCPASFRRAQNAAHFR
jgi:hypothetical protein